MRRFIPLLTLLFAAHGWAAGPSFMDLGMNPRGQAPADKAMQGLAGKPPDALLELRELYARYVEVVTNKRELDRWDAGLETGTLVEHPDERLLPARQAEDALRRRTAELRRLEEESAAIKGEFKEAKREDLALEIDKKKRAVRAARRSASRSKGLDIDWSDVIWAELMKLDPEEWSVTDATRDARPRHTAAVVCTPAEQPTLCLAFDPWWRGEPDVYEYDTWNKGETTGRVPAEFFLHHLPERRRGKR